MKRFYCIVLFIIMLMALYLTGCKKQIETSTTGSISGKCSPHEAVKSITAQDASGTESIAVLDSSNGFSIANLPTGTYTVSFAATLGYIAPGDTIINIKAGEHADMGTILFKVDSTASERLGTIIGKVSPAAGVSAITATNVSGQAYPATVDTSGDFSFGIIPPGHYTIRFTPATGFIAPDDTTVTLYFRNVTDLGTIVLATKPSNFKAIDTITENVGSIYWGWDAQENLNAFINRAKNDSAIVLLYDLILTQYMTITPELQEAFNKIIVIKEGLMVDGGNFTSLAFPSLKELGSLHVNSGGDQLKSIDLGALQKITSEGIWIYDCASLTLQMDALKTLSGSLHLDGTGFVDLTAFKDIPFTPYSIEILNNDHLLSLNGLHLTSDSIYNCTIQNNAELTSLDGLQGIKRIRHIISVTDNPVLQSLTGLENTVFAKQLTLTNNGQLNAVCAGKQLTSYLKDQPPFKDLVPSGQGPSFIEVTKDPLVVSNNGVYATQDDLLTAIQQCP